MKKILYILTVIIISSAFSSNAFDRRIKVVKPNLDSIKAESTNESSRFYYPRLLKKFMENDTVMTNEEYRYFYYGTLFQEDYEAYREPYNEAQLEEIQPLYYKNTHTKAEKDAMYSYAKASLEDNPLDLVQLKNLIYVYEKKQKVNLAKIWKSKLNHLLYVIFASGTGLNTDSPWIVVYPRHEFDIFNIYGVPVQSQEYQEPHFDHFTVKSKSGSTENYYFDLGPVLEQYYFKHPSELNPE